VIRVVLSELATSSMDAVLRPVSAEWTAVTPAMRRLELAAGPSVEAQCRANGELPVGSAIITGAGELQSSLMIHVVVRSIDEPVSAAGVLRGLENGLRRIREWGVQRVAMPPLGTGAGNLDADDAAAIMVPALVAAMRAGGPPQEVEIHVDAEYDHDVFARHVQHALGEARQ
jgi:O-acetyl-ADP-ribose deacetylase (regulator of RNase III)